MDLSLNNAWLLYMRDFEQVSARVSARDNQEKEKPLSLYEFKSIISYTLRNQHRPLKKSGRPCNPLVINPLVRQRAPKRPFPPTGCVREDQVGHFLVTLKKRGYCRVGACKRQIVTYCMKCKVYLCSVYRRQCFLDFHGIDYDLEELPH